MSTKQGPPRTERRLAACRLFRAAPLVLSFLAFTGCSWDNWGLLPNRDPLPPPQGDSLVIRPDGIEPDKQAENRPANLLAAHEQYRAGQYGKAESMFHKIAENKKNSPQIGEEARFYEAECLRRRGKYPKAADTYAKMLNDFPSGSYREQATQSMFEIANFWLKDTRREMELAEEKRQGKRSVVWPEWFHLEQEKPFFDQEGRAIEKLEQVRYNDITGPLADKALFLAGGVKFFRGDYKEADYYYSQLVEMHPNSSYAPQAIKLALISKEMATGGPAYDGRKLAEARKLVDSALRSYPELMRNDNDFLNRQLFSITQQQAQKDYDVAEFYRRTGHPCSAYFCYEIVRRRYPGTRFHGQATEKMAELKTKLEADGETMPDKPAPGTLETNSRPGPQAPSLTPGGVPSAPPKQLPPGVLQ